MLFLAVLWGTERTVKIKMSEGVIGPSGEIRIPAAHFFVFFGLLVLLTFYGGLKVLAVTRGLSHILC